MPTLQNNVSQRRAASIFDSIPPTDDLHLFRNGRVNPNRIKKILSYTNEDIAVASGVPFNSVRFDAKMPADLQERLMEWAIAISKVHTFFQNEEKTMLWFRVPNPMLGDATPRDMIRIGRFKKLLKFIQDSNQENEC